MIFFKILFIITFFFFLLFSRLVMRAPIKQIDAVDLRCIFRTNLVLIVLHIDIISIELCVPYLNFRRSWILHVFNKFISLFAF